jgi:RNase E specificity factor CsrD
MRLSTKFSAFITLLTGLTIFVILIGCSLSFYNAIQGKLISRVQAVASVIDNRLVSTPFAGFSDQLDELMAPTDIVSIEIQQGKETVFSHQRTGVYHPAGAQLQYRELYIHSLKNPGMTIKLVYQDPMTSCGTAGG